MKTIDQIYYAMPRERTWLDRLRLWWHDVHVGELMMHSVAFLFLAFVVFWLLALTTDAVLGRAAWPAKAACLQRGMNYTRRDLSTEVACVPKYNGLDSLQVNLNAEHK